MPTTRDAETGRAELAEWERAQPSNFYTSDHNLQSILKFYWGPEKLGDALPRLSEFGAEAATTVDDAVRHANLSENLPRLERYSGVGERTENVAHSREHDIAGEAIYASGAMSVYATPGSNLLALALFYLSSYNGEAGHNCPLACTAGIIKTLQNAGSDSLRTKYLPRLLDPHYRTRFHGAQFLTEVQGGSDVGTNSLQARELDPAQGTWLLNGEKWFCSNVTADLALVTARPENAPGGTKGLGLFLVPRHLDDGTPNGLYIRRLKDKLGTRSLATAELDFRDALEAAIEALCVRELDGRAVRPKIIASTATVRRAQDRIQALFGRSLTQVFPPPGPDRRDSFFARTIAPVEAPGRLYTGIAAQGRNPKEVMRRVWLTLMGAAELAYRDAGGHKNHENPADPYMTVLGYFNSLRELGGARRMLEEQIRNTLKNYGTRRRIGQEVGLFQSRKTFSEVLELTSRVTTDKVAEARRRLGCGFHEAQRVDCAIATNMISVGLDIPRLGLMVVFGQPKMHSEYIQATSRVGRTQEGPGLVVTLLNIHKPRDRSHYERFRHYHESFYRSVEVGSVTPFSARALDRGFAGALVGLARHSQDELTPPRGAEHIAAVRPAVERRLLDAFLERVRQQPMADEAEREERLRSVQNRVVDLLDSWTKIFEDYRLAGAQMQYQKYELDQPRPLLREILDTDFESEHHRKFHANRSLRNVEPSVNLFLKDLSGIDVEEQP